MTQTFQTEPLEFNNDQVHVVVLHQASCRIEMTVKTFSALIQKARLEAVKAVGKEVMLPGFRKGKAPNGMILKKFPAEVEKETHRTLADIVFAEAQKLANIPLLNHNAQVTFDLKKMNAEEAELVFTFETEPQVPTVDPKQFIPQSVEQRQATDKEIDEAIRQAQFFFADWKSVSDRPVAEKDYVQIDLDTIDGEKTERVFNSVRFEVSKDRMAEWMQKLIIGANVGDVLEGMSEPDADATEEEKKEFQPKKIRITILKLEEASLPELNDEFARKLGALDIVQMRNSVTDMLNRQLEEKAHNALRDQVNDFLTATYSFELPKSLIKTETEHRHQQLFHNPKFRKEWNQMSQEDKASFEKKLIVEAANAVRLFYLSRQVVRDAKIGITHREVQNEAIATLRAHGVQEQIPVDKIPKDIYALALSKVILARAQDHIIKAQKEA